MDVITARALLGVSPSARADMIKRAFRRLAVTSHPDCGGDARAFGRLVEAQRLALDAVAAAPTNGGSATRGRWVDGAADTHQGLSVLDSPVVGRHRAGPVRAGSTDSIRSRSLSFGDVLAEKLAAA